MACATIAARSGSLEAPGQNSVASKPPLPPGPASQDAMSPGAMSVCVAVASTITPSQPEAVKFICQPCAPVITPGLSCSMGAVVGTLHNRTRDKAV